MRMLICTGWATLVRVPQIQLFGVFSFGPNQFELHTKDKLAAWSYIHGVQNFIQLCMIWPGKFWHWTLLDMVCVHSTMTWGAAMSAAADRITVKEVKASRQRRSSTWIFFCNKSWCTTISLFYFVPPWLQISTLTLFLLPRHQLWGRRHLNTITQFDPCTI